MLKIGFSYFLGCQRQGHALVRSQLPGTGLLPPRAVSSSRGSSCGDPADNSLLPWHCCCGPCCTVFPVGWQAVALGFMSHGLCVSHLIPSGFSFKQIEGNPSALKSHSSSCASGEERVKLVTSEEVVSARGCRF